MISELRPQLISSMPFNAAANHHSSPLTALCHCVLPFLAHLDFASLQLSSNGCSITRPAGGSCWFLSVIKVAARWLLLLLRVDVQLEEVYIFSVIEICSGAER